MVCLHIDEVGILEPTGDSAPIPEVRGDYNLFALALSANGDLKTESLTDAIVGYPERMDGKVADRKRSVKIGAYFEVQEGGLTKMPAGQMSNLFLVNVDGNPAVFQNPEGGIMNVIAVKVGDDHPVNCGEQLPEGFSAGSHRGESGIDEQGGFTRFQEQRVPRTTAAQRLEGKEQYGPLAFRILQMLVFSSIGMKELYVKLIDSKPKNCMKICKAITPTLPSPLRGGGLGWGERIHRR